MWLLDIASLTWMQPHGTGKKPSGRWGHSATLVQHTMYVYGGVYDSKMLNELYALDTQTWQWTLLELPKSIYYYL